MPPSSSPTSAQSVKTGAFTSSSGSEAIRKGLVALFIVIASFSSALYVFAHWTHDQVLNTDNWVQYTSALPKDPDVSWALADKLTNQIFTSVPIEQKIEEVLPPRAEFLAAPLSEQLRTRTANRLEQVVSSDPFQDVWASANRRAMDRILTQARSEDGETRQLRVFNIELGGMGSMVQQRIENGSPVLTAIREKGASLLQVKAGLDAARGQVRGFVKVTDALNTILPPIFIASLTAALALARHRRKALLLAAATTIVLLLIELISIRVAKHQLLSNVQVDQYIPAVSFIYDSLFDSLRNIIFSSLLFWSVVAVLVMFFGESAWAVRMRKFLRIYDLSDSKLTRWFRRTRMIMAEHLTAIVVAIVGFVLLVLAFAATPEPVLIMRALLVSLSIIFCVYAIADTESYRREMYD